MSTIIQLPDDVQSIGYQETKPFTFEQVFFSPSLGFTGTEKEFLQSGHAYQYRNLDPYRRMTY